MKKGRTLLCFVIAMLFIPSSNCQKGFSPPDWKAGETVFYRIQIRNNRTVRTRSAIALPDVPNELRTEGQGLLGVEILEKRGVGNSAAYRLRTHFTLLNTTIGAIRKGQKPTDEELQRVSPDDKAIECTLQPDGQIKEISGLEKLEIEQQEAWREWASRFSAVYGIPIGKWKRGDKWASQEPETTPSPIAELEWQKKSQYVRDEPCASVQMNSKGDYERAKQNEACAVIVTTATLVQKSSTKDATPPDYKTRGLHTRGTAKGTNDTTLYISKKTGMLIRSRQEANQEMDVYIALAIGSNQVHYSVTAKGNSTVELFTGRLEIFSEVPEK
jgi:hypothetical protein